MLEHQKKILQEVSYSRNLFKKELIKSFCWLTADEQMIFENWLYDNFNNRYPEIIDQIVSEYAQPFNT